MTKSLSLQLLVVVALICNLSITNAFTQFQAVNRRLCSPTMMVARSANKRSSSNRPSRSAAPDRNSKPQQTPRLGQREGARPLSKSELKAKDIYEATKEPEVARLHALEDRKPLSELKVGQKLRGRIISVKEFGLFVDIGAKRDGLVHVKDISKDYFIQNHQQKFIPGQDVDVWIKFVEDENYKLGLQMYPLVERLAAKEGVEPLALANLEAGDEVSGTVVRVSNYGVYVDIGAEVDAFLHMRKMKTTRKQRSLKPWEVMPVGSKVENAFVLEVDAGRKRCALTTYPPEQWEDMLPLRTEANANMVEDEEELGGSTMAANYRALERTLSLTADDDDEDFDEDGEELSVEEIEALAESRSRRAQVLIDDVGDSSDGSDADDVMAEGRRSGASNMEEGEEISVEELFQELCGRGRDYITVRDLKKWDYVQDLLADGDIDEDSLAELAREAGAVQGKMQEDEFDAFIELLADSLGLEDDDGTFDEDDNDSNVRSKKARDDDNVEDGEEDDGLIAIDDFDEDGILSFSTTPSASKPAAAAAAAKKPATNPIAAKKFDAVEEEEEEEDDEELSDISLMGGRDEDDEADFGLGFGGTVLGTGPFSSPDGNKEPLAEMYEKKSRSNDLLNYVFGSVAGKKGYAELSDVLSWEFARSLISQGVFTEQSVKSLFEKCKPKNGRLSKEGFEKLVELMSEPEVTGQSTKKSTADDVLKKKVEKELSGDGSGSAVNIRPAESLREITTASSAKASSGREEEEEEEEDEDDYEEEISIEEAFEELANGKETATFEAVSEWDIVAELLEEGLLSKEDFSQLFLQAGGKKVKKGGKSTSVIDFEGFETLLDLLAPIAGFEEDEEIDETSMRHLATDDEIAAVEADDDNDMENDEDLDDDGGVSDEELTKSVFEDLANGKKVVTVKDLMGWDIVLDLMGEGLLTDDILREKLANCPGYNGKGVPLEGFGQLVDELVELYGDAAIEEEGDGLETDVEEKVVDTEEAEEEDDDDVIEIDTEEVFDEVAKGKDHITFKDLQEWELIAQLKAEGDFDEGALRKLVKDAGVEDPNKIDIMDFEAILDELAGDDEEYEEEEDDA